MSVISTESRAVLPMETKDICERSDMEETGIHNTKVSDSGYSNSCSNSQSQRSGSSKSRNSGSSSGSSGYCGHPSTLGSSNDSFQRPSTMKRKEYKKKKLKAMAGELLNDSGGGTTSGMPGQLETIPAVASSPHTNIDTTFLSSTNPQNTEKESIQLNPLSHPTLSINCMKKLKGKDVNTGEETCEVTGVPSPADRIDNKDDSKVVTENIHKSSAHKEEFSVVVSMQEGVVLYTTSSLTDVLGYPQDMWLGRSLIDFVHPRDRKALNSHIASGIATPQVERRDQNGQNAAANKRNSFYCCLRQYRGLKSTGFSVINKKVSYLPCQLTLAFREISTKFPVLDDNDNKSKEVPKDGDVVRAILLVITARLVHSVYKIPNEICASSTYTTRHSASMIFTHVDSEVVTYFGYLPQDMVGRSVFDYYHPEDLPYLKEVYENVFKDKGQPFRSKPYRFRTQNGGFAVIETDWSSFVNPWTKKIEFVTGQHRVIKGPPNPDVITPSGELEPLQISEEVLKESNTIQEEIISILNEQTAETSNSSKRQMTKFCKELLTFMENFVDEEKTSSEKTESKPVSLSISGRDSVMLGEISPHHDYYDSKSSSETPPSYTQLNYNDNIQRFFESKPKTTLSDESGDSKTSLCGERNPQLSGGDDEGKISPNVDSICGGSQNRSILLHVNWNSGLNNESGGSSDLSFGSASGGGGGNNDATINKYRTPHLTEELLSKHNENMEKKMVQRHRERSKSDRENKLKDGRHKKNYDKILDEQNAHGVKRSGSHSWEGEPYKTIKQTHINAEQAATGSTTAANPYNVQTTTTVYSKPAVATSTNINLWPPFSVTVTPLHSSQPCATHLSYSAAPLTNTVMPVYYLPPDHLPSSTRPTNCTTESRPSLSSYVQPQPPYGAGQFQYMNSMMYHPVATAMPMFSVPPVIYSPLTLLPAPLLATQPMKPQSQSQQSGFNNINTQHEKKSTNSKLTRRPASQATSVKAEPGSALCSIASNSLQQALSETSKREEKSLGTPSPESITSHPSPCSVPEKIKQDLEINSNDILESTVHNDSSSYYSSFYSYMKTDEKSDESMKSLTENDSSVETNAENKHYGIWKKKFAKNACIVPDQLHRRISKVPPWLENVAVTPDLIFRYQLSERELSDVLEADLKLLNEIHQQPLTVNDQLCQLYLDIENFHQQDCSLETSIGITSSSGTSSGEGDDAPLTVKTKKKYRTMEYHDKMVMLFEENAPLPPPLSHNNGAPSLLSVQTT
ncbi:period circadian regulator isoform X2 [Lycorma delicatula]|uniref:period circadian regulator isoform X2 n=1 Tax=Lycorma delicatula TaxID=130591 RepID=UPI003F51563C